MKYDYNDIKRAYKNIGISRGMTISLKTDLRFLGPFDDSKFDLLSAHYNILADLVDLSEGTIVVSTATFSLCNTSKVFDIANTPSEMGVLTEYIRTKPESVRSLHPFASHTAIGKNANYICSNVARHSYGPDTPKARLLELDTQYLSIGMPPSEITMTIHQIERLMGVPYRYVKEFIQPILRENEIVYEPFYLDVRYLECNARMDLNNKVYPNFFKCGYKVKEEVLGRGKIYSFSMYEFYLSTIQLLKNDLYACLASEPSEKPFQT